MLVDSHSHFDAPEFDGDRDAALARARAAGVTRQVVPAVAASSWPKLREVCAQDAGLFAAYVFNANSTSQPLYARHGMHAWPGPTHSLKLSWILDPLTLAGGRFYRAAHQLAPDIVSRWGERLLNRRLAQLNAHLIREREGHEEHVRLLRHQLDQVIDADGHNHLAWREAQARCLADGKCLGCHGKAP